MRPFFTKTNLPPPLENFDLSDAGEIDNFPCETESQESSHLILFRQYKLYQGELWSLFLEGQLFYV